jgi:hypothetical protein
MILIYVHIDSVSVRLGFEEECIVDRTAKVTQTIPTIQMFNPRVK